jgi:D-xylose transport system substrate-binding protein
VLLLVNLDSGSGAAIAANAKSQDVSVIDYDRLTLDTDATDYYVSFDNEVVGNLQGEGLVACMEDSGVSNPAVAVLNGSPTDNNATLFKNGYDAVINPLFDSGDWTEVDDQSVPDWDNQQALTIFEQMLQKTSNKIDGVLAANDGLGNAVISALQQRKLDAIPVTGQDATAQGIQHVLAGDQCMTVYKAVQKEADAAAQLAIALSKGTEPPSGLVNGKSDDGSRQVPSVLLEPQAITKENAGVPIEDGFLKKEDVCTGKYASLCTEAGI